MEVKAYNVRNLDSMKHFFYAGVYRGKNPKKHLIKRIILSVILIILAVINYIQSDGVEWFFFGLIFAILMYANISRYVSGPKKQYEALSKMKDELTEFVFYEDRYQSVTKSSLRSVVEEVDYCMLVKVIETSKYIVLFLGEATMEVVDKSTVNNGTVDDIRNKLKEYVRTNYLMADF